MFGNNLKKPQEKFEGILGRTVRKLNKNFGKSLEECREELDEGLSDNLDTLTEQ